MRLHFQELDLISAKLGDLWIRATPSNSWTEIIIVNLSTALWLGVPVLAQKTVSQTSVSPAPRNLRHVSSPP